MPPEIRRLADMFLINPKEITVSRPATPSQNIEQGLVMIPHRIKRDIAGLQKKKREALRHLIKQEDVKNALIFCNRKRDVDIVHKSFQKHGFNTATLHGDMSQPARSETMERFKSGQITFLVCSDVAARGLDIVDLSHVFNFDVPTHAEDYVHRIGRTGRAGKTGKAFTLAWKEEQKFLDSIKRITGEVIPQISIVELQLGGGGQEKKPKRQPNSNQNQSNLRKQRNSASRSREEDDLGDNGQPAVGMGGHVPAFLMRPVKS